MRLRGVVALGVLVLMGCSHSADSSPTNEASAAATDRPSIHFDQTSVLMVDGQPQEEASYRSLLDACQKSGMTTHALSLEDVSKIGRVHVEAWIGSDKQSRHTEEWHQNISAPCQFILVHKDQTEIVDANGRSTLIDGVTHKADVQDLGPPSPVTAVPSGDGAMDDAAKQAGWTKLNKATANGVECSIWQNAEGFQLCVWTGGGKWGYSAYGVDALKDGMSQGSSIVLWSHPGKGAAWQLQTREFSVGKSLDSAAFNVPANVTVSSASP